MKRILLVLTAALGLTIAGIAPVTAATAAPTITGIAARSGPLAGGDLVTIRGHDLTGTTSVLFGGTPTSTDLQTIDDTHLIVRAPAHAAGGTYVQVVRADATSTPSKTAVYDYVPAPSNLKDGPQHARPSGGADAVYCASASLCLSSGIVRGASRTQVFGVLVKDGSTWGRRLEFGGHVETAGLACAVTPRRLCMAGNTDGTIWRYQGHAWHRTLVSPGHAIAEVSCPTSSFCMAVTANGSAYHWTGTRWTGPARLTDELVDISCPATTFCYAVGSRAMGVRWIGTHWVAAHPIATDRDLGALGRVGTISCSSATFCMAGGDFRGGNSNRIVFTGVAWSPPNSDNDQLQGETQSRVTCTSPLFCLNPNGFTETEYHYTVYNGAVTFASSTFRDPVTCWAAYQCLTAAGTGWRYLTRAGG